MSKEVLEALLLVLMSREQQKRGKQEKGSDGAEKVIVAVKASKEIPKTALVWSLTHVVHPGDCITLLVVVPSQSSGNEIFSIISLYLLFCQTLFIAVWSLWLPISASK